MIRVFKEGTNIMIDTSKEEFSHISDDGAKLQISPERARKLITALQDITVGIEILTRQEKNRIQPTQGNIDLIDGLIRPKEI